LTCSEPPAGYSRWAFRLVADKLVGLEVVATTSNPTVRRTRKKVI